MSDSTVAAARPGAVTDGGTVFGVIVAISFCHMLNDMMQSLLPAIYPGLKTDLHLTFGQIGLVTLAYQITASILQPLVGLYADKRPTPMALPGGTLFSLAGLSVLVMGYPCAIGISAPLSIVRGAGQAAEHGILMRTGEAFQGFRTVKQIVFDKTGTLTEGRPTVREIETVDVSEQELLAIAAAAETSSEHPLAQAVVKMAFERGATPPEVQSFEAYPGMGVVARIDAGDVLVGSPRFLTDRRVDLTRLHKRIDALEAAGRTVIAVARDGRALGIVALGDTLRPDAISAVATLRKAGLKTILVTGDNERAARRVAGDLGIDEVHAGVLPQDKAAIVRELQAKARVAMVGDGVNDAPALMQADIGIAMGAGTDIAIEAADIIILSNRLDALPVARDISRRSYGKMVQNVVLAFLFNGGGIPLAATGLIHPVWAMVAMAVSVTAIFINSLWGSPRLFFDAIRSVGRPITPASPQPI